MLVRYLNKKYTNIKYLFHKRNIEKKLTRQIEIDTNELFLSQRKNEVFNRYDIVIRYLAIENYYGMNEFGFSLYKKMQSLRNPSDDLEIYEKNFRELIESFEKGGYSKESEILVDEDIQIEDGAHRVSVSLFFGIEKLNIQVLPKKGKTDYSMDWFKLNGFMEEECNIIIQKAKEIEEKCNKCIAVILWPKVYQYFDEITNRIGMVWNVIEVKDIRLKKETFSRAVKGIYYVDDISEERIQDKIEHLGCEDNLTLRVIKVKVSKPYFRLKKDNGHTLLKQGEKIKSIIRTHYKKKINDYYFDNIIHTADNYYQSRHIIDLFYNEINLNNYFTVIFNYNWMLIKLHTNYLPDDFPKNFAFSKDIDILCDERSFRNMVDNTREHINNAYGIRYEIREIEEKDKWRIRIEKNGFLILQIDISKAIEGIAPTFVSEALTRRVKHNEYGYFSSKESDEFYFRVNEFMKHPNKTWHLEYIRDKREFLDKDKMMQIVNISEEECECLINKVLLLN